MHTNRLAQEKSPYLLQHAHNPVDWYPWGTEAFEKARRENRPATRDNTPGLFSTVTVWPRILVSSCAVAREAMSTAPAGVKGQIRRIDFEG